MYPRLDSAWLRTHNLSQWVSQFDLKYSFLGNHEQDEDVKSAKEVDRDSGTGDDKVSSILGSDQEVAEDNVEEQGKLFWCQVW